MSVAESRRPAPAVRLGHPRLAVASVTMPVQATGVLGSGRLDEPALTLDLGAPRRGRAGEGARWASEWLQCKFPAGLLSLIQENFLTEREQLSKIQSLLTGGVPV